jgi:hypothetical protein
MPGTSEWFYAKTVKTISRNYNDSCNLAEKVQCRKTAAAKDVEFGGEYVLNYRVYEFGK